MQCSRWASARSWPGVCSACRSSTNDAWSPRPRRWLREESASYVGEACLPHAFSRLGARSLRGPGVHRRVLLVGDQVGAVRVQEDEKAGEDQRNHERDDLEGGPERKTGDDVVDQDEYGVED